MKLIFLDIDGVLVNRESLSRGSGQQAKGAPQCVVALNRIIAVTGAKIVISSCWRVLGVLSVRDHLQEWGVLGQVIGCTPILQQQFGAVILSQTRHQEIQGFLDSYLDCEIDDYVIIDDENMGHLNHKLIRTNFEVGLTEGDANRAIQKLTGRSIFEEELVKRMKGNR